MATAALCRCGRGRPVSPWPVCRECLDRAVGSALVRVTKPPAVVKPDPIHRSTRAYVPEPPSSATMAKEVKMIEKAKAEGRYDPTPLPRGIVIFEGTEPGFCTTSPLTRTLVPSGIHAGHPEGSALAFWKWLCEKGWIEHGWGTGAANEQQREPVRVVSCVVDETGEQTMSTPFVALRVWKMIYGSACGDCFFRYIGGGPGAITLCEKMLREHCQHCRIALGKPRQVLEPAEPPHAEARVR